MRSLGYWGRSVMSLHRLNANDVFLNERNVVMKSFFMSDTQGAIWEESLVVGGFYCHSAGQAINIIMSPRGVAIYSILFFSVLYGWLCNNGH